MVNTQKRNISAKEAARILGTSQMIIKDLILKGKLPGFVTQSGSGRDRIIIPRAKFDEFMGEKTGA